MRRRATPPLPPPTTPSAARDVSKTSQATALKRVSVGEVLTAATQWREMLEGRYATTGLVVVVVVVILRGEQESGVNWA